MTLHDDLRRWENAVKTMKTLRMQVGERLASGLIPVALSALAAVGMAASLSAEASQFGVRVVNNAGEPVSGASVCVGLPGNYKQFGALFTDADGMAMTDVPNVPLVVTISKTRFSGVRMSEPARGFTLVREVRLSDGIPGPRCRAGSTIADGAAIKVDNVHVIDAANATTLEFSVSGEPSHYRVATSSEFYDARWLDYQPSIVLPLSLARRGQIFLQMRRFEGTSNAWLEARSEVVEVLMPIAVR